MGNVTCCNVALSGSEVRLGIKGKRKVKCNGKTFAPYGMRNSADPPVKMSSFNPDGAGSADKVDLRKWMTTVEDQSQSNSCCANAVAGAYEYINKREAMKRGDTTADISRLFIYYVGRKKDQLTYGDDTKMAPQDEGMTLGGAISALQLKGACMEEDWPFDLTKVNDRPDDHCFDKAMKFKISEARKVPLDLQAMKACLAKGDPIVFGLKLTAQFFHPMPGGFIPTPDPSDPQSSEHGLHAMLLVGYSDRQNVFIVRNSWSTSWGDSGYAYVPYDYIANSEFNFLGMYAITGLTEVDFTPDEDDGGDFTFEQGAEDKPDLNEYQDDPDEIKEDGFDAEDAFNPDSEARRAFAKFDLNGNGTMDVMELHVALMMTGNFVYPHQLEAIMKKCNVDGKPELSFEEFLRISKVKPSDLG
mmetsp:Transcript_44107/g.103026  ORF Transcript_44107/g.103026 Transcript_44107/m.103026 type:complete len:415 (+) Transcript_44107:59-1303(+)